MPHCIIECSKIFSEKTKELVKAAHLGAVNSQLFNKEDIKSRAITYEHYQTGTSNIPFIHVVCKLLSGRNDEQKLSLSRSILSEIKKLDIGPCAITVEIIDIDANSYTKEII